MTHAIAIWILVAISFSAGLRVSGNKQKRWPMITFTLCFLLAICLLLQLMNPSLLPLFERNASAMYQGQWWRIFTALFFQDGWLWGGISNIILLALIGSLTEQFFGRLQWISLYFLVGILTEVFALKWQPLGAGNSIAVMGLAASIIIYALVKQRSTKTILLGTLSILPTLFLLLQHDIHGMAFLIGLLATMIIAHKSTFHTSIKSSA
jgi:membrane associated rhomboid family serine protease